MKELFWKIRNNNFFEGTVILIIMISAIAIGFRTYEESFSPQFFLYLSYLDYFVSAFFLVEISIRIFSEQKIFNFFKSAWNIFDFCIVIISLVPIENIESVLLARLVRIFRLLRLVTFIPEFRALIESFLKAIPRVGYVLMFMFVEFYIFAAIGSILFAEISPMHWGNIGLAMLTLFQTATLEGWPDLMYQSLEFNSYSWIFFVVFIIVNSLILMNMIVGVIIDVIVKENDKDQPENIQKLEKIQEELTIIRNKIDLMG